MRHGHRPGLRPEDDARGTRHVAQFRPILDALQFQRHAPVRQRHAQRHAPRGVESVPFGDHLLVRRPHGTQQAGGVAVDLFERETQRSKARTRARAPSACASRRGGRGGSWGRVTGANGARDETSCFRRIAVVRKTKVGRSSCPRASVAEDAPRKRRNPRAQGRGHVLVLLYARDVVLEIAPSVT